MTRLALQRQRMVLAAGTAEDLMTSNPISIHGDATVREAIEMMTDRGFTAAPVIDDAGHPIGVVSRTDILVHEREQVRHAKIEDDTDWDAPPRRQRHEGFEVEVVDRTLVRDIMTPVVFTVTEDTPADQVVDQMLKMKVHQLFVVDEDCALVGAVTALDLLRHMIPEEM